jgi:cysteinyl-tRNA synthetase
MLNVNGQKMSKAFGNYFLPFDILEGTTSIFSKPFSAQVVRFFMMMGHYRSDLDFSNDALIAAEKGYDRLTDAFLKIGKLTISETTSIGKEIEEIRDNCATAMNDDFNTSKLIAELFELATLINKIDSKTIYASQEDLENIHKLVQDYFVKVLGIQFENGTETNSQAMEHLMQLIIDIRKESREKKDFATSDKIRDVLTQAGIELRDGKDGTDWKI